VGRQERVFYSGVDACAAWLYPADGNATSVPMVVMAHGLSGTRRDRLGAFAERFAQAGIAALFDIYDGPQHEAVLADQVTFLHRHLMHP
jgi:fermentation-respiration switch protein FrsA (DUF1100 family)